IRVPLTTHYSRFFSHDSPLTTHLSRFTISYTIFVSMLHPSTIKFLKDLKKNNNKPWFDAHRPQYETAKQDFAEFIQLLIDKQGTKDNTIASMKAKECMFRINRDVRFAKDKSPYKSNFGASIIKGGKKSIFAGYYFHCEPGQS